MSAKRKTRSKPATKRAPRRTAPTPATCAVCAVVRRKLTPTAAFLVGFALARNTTPGTVGVCDLHGRVLDDLSDALTEAFAAAVERVGDFPRAGGGRM